eukprot:139830-Chlamydomonas_euryale.AAC.4
MPRRQTPPRGWARLVSAARRERAPRRPAPGCRQFHGACHAVAPVGARRCATQQPQRQLERLNDGRGRLDALRLEFRLGQARRNDAPCTRQLRQAADAQRRDRHDLGAPASSATNAAGPAGRGQRQRGRRGAAAQQSSPAAVTAAPATAAMVDALPPLPPCQRTSP